MRYGYPRIYHFLAVCLLIGSAINCWSHFYVRNSQFAKLVPYNLLLKAVSQSSADSDSQPGSHCIRLNNSGSQPVLILNSARYDRTRQLVVLVGYFKHRFAPVSSVICRLESPSLRDHEAIQQVMKEILTKNYIGVLFFCPAKDWKPTENSLVHIKVIFNSSFPAASHGNLVLPVQFAKSKEIRPSLAACIAPLRHLPSRESETRFILRLVEFIEVSRILSIQHFYFYNWSLPLGISRTLRHYAALGLVTIRQWSLPAEIHPENDIHYFGQLPTINDCLYAARDEYRLVAFIDIDEFLVPIGGLVGTLEEAARQHGLTMTNETTAGAPCAVGFRHALFRLKSDADMLGTMSQEAASPGLKGCHLATVQHYLRDSDVAGYPYRSKTLVVARQIKEMGIHQVSDTWTGCQTKILNPEKEGLLHHIRKCRPGPIKSMWKDASMRRFKKFIEHAMIGARLRFNRSLGFDICQ